MADRFHSVEQAVVAALRWVNGVAMGLSAAVALFTGLIGVCGFAPQAMLAVCFLAGIILVLSLLLDRRIERNLERLDRPDPFDAARAEIASQPHMIPPDQAA